MTTIEGGVFRIDDPKLLIPCHYFYPMVSFVLNSMKKNTDEIYRRSFCVVSHIRQVSNFTQDRLIGKCFIE